MRQGYRVISSVFVGCGLLSLTSCRTPFMPPVRPVANLYPTLHDSAILDSVSPVDVSARGLREALAHAGLLTELEAFGLSEVELLTAVRGLQRRGYAEIDARRSDCPVRWVILRPRREDGRRHLYMEAGLRRRPSLAMEAGIDLSVPPARSQREDIYGRRYTILTWLGTAGDVPVAVRRVFDVNGQALHWELACRFPLGQD